MTTLLDKLNLRPQERRLVVMTAVVLFVMLQIWLVWPHFKDWGDTKALMKKSRTTLETYRAEFARTNDYQARLEQLENQGSSVLVEEQAQGTLLVQRIGAQARESRVGYSGINILLPSASSKTNEFFAEQTINLGVTPTGAQELVDFLVAIGSSDLMIRVKDLSLNPDNPVTRYKLVGNMKLVASFQKKAQPKPGAAKPAGPPSTPVAATKP